MNKPFNYQAEAEQTNSPHYHATKVPCVHFENVIMGAMASLGDLDDIKKAVFYGRELPQSTLDMFSRETRLDQMFEPESKAMTVPLVHSIIGIATEAGELLEMFLKPEFDRINFIEEVGDVMWYLAIGLNAVGSTFEEAQRTNIAKLRKRYPEKFTEYDANNRDLKAERDVLENPFREAYEIGRKAFHDCLTRNHNPYPPQWGVVGCYSEWEAGWNDEYVKANSPKPIESAADRLIRAKKDGQSAHTQGLARDWTWATFELMGANEENEWLRGWDEAERKAGSAIKVAINGEGKRFMGGLAPVEGAILRQDYYVDGHRLNFQQAQTYIALKQTGKLGELLDRYEIPM